MTDIWNLDTSLMTLEELEAYKQELQRLEERDRQRRVRNIRLIIYALVIVLIGAGVVSIPGYVRYHQGPVILGEPDMQGEQEEGPGDHCWNQVERISDHSFVLCIEKRDSNDWDYDWDDWEDISSGYYRIEGTITADPEPLNRQGKSTVTYSDGTTGAVWFEKRYKYHSVYLEIEYKGNVYGFPWYSLDRYEELMK